MCKCIKPKYKLEEEPNDTLIKAMEKGMSLTDILLPKKKREIGDINDSQRRVLIWDLFLTEYPEYKKIIEKYNA